jgi:hypothetical protein
MLSSNLLATLATFAAQGLKIEVSETVVTITADKGNEAPKAPETANKGKGEMIVAKFKNGGIFRSWNIEHYTKEERKTLQMFALLFNDGFHAYQIAEMAGFPRKELECIAREYRFTFIRRNVVDSLRFYTVGLIARIKAI